MEVQRMEAGSLPGESTGIRELGPGIEYSLLSAIFEFLPHGVAFIDPNLVIRAANEAFGREMRRPLSDIINRPAEEAIPGWTAQVSTIYHHVREAGEALHCDAFPFEFHDQPERGVTYWEFTVCPVYEPDREFGGYLLTHREVTGRERELQSREQGSPLNDR
jgi:PAS domain-containing protein